MSKIDTLLLTSALDWGRTLRLRMNRLYHVSKQRELRKEKYYQKDKFNELSKKFSDYYQKICRIEAPKGWLTSLWEKYNKKIEKVFLPFPDFSFLINPVIAKAMVVNKGGKLLKEQIKYLKKTFSQEQLEKYLKEEYCGDPVIYNNEYMTSHNSIHHLYHFARFFNTTNCELENIDSVVEWGGGYGNLARIFSLINKDFSSYIIIDTPLFSCLQWLYLSTIFGEEKVNLIRSSDSGFKKNKYNLLPISLLKDYEINKSDLFIATWSLSESSKIIQEYVYERNFFGAKKLLIAYQNKSDLLPDSELPGEYAKKSGAIIEDLSVFKNHEYAFK